MFLARIVDCSETTVLARMFGNKNSFSCHVDFIMNQICRFCVDYEKETRQEPYRGQPQASHGISM